MTELTFLNGLFAHIAEKGNIDQDTINRIIQFMKSHQFDSDAFKDDLNVLNNQQSNLYRVSNQNMEFMSTSNHFITNIYCMIYIV